jgi:hypothetical protein
MTFTPSFARRCLNVSKCLLPILLSVGLTSCQEDEIFQQIDVSKDGRISQEEFERFMTNSIFAEVDKDLDGKGNEADWKAANPDASSRQFREVDTNRDRSVTLAETAAYYKKEGKMAALFSEMDTNRDRYLSKSEIAKFQSTFQD